MGPGGPADVWWSRLELSSSDSAVSVPSSSHHLPGTPSRVADPCDNYPPAISTRSLTGKPHSCGPPRADSLLTLAQVCCGLSFPSVDTAALGVPLPSPQVLLIPRPRSKRFWFPPPSPGPRTPSSTGRLPRSPSGVLESTPGLSNQLCPQQRRGLPRHKLSLHTFT